MRRARSSLFALLSVNGLLGACGIAPVTTTPAPPPVVVYVDPHARPRAYGGGTCPIIGRHGHVYPPTPSAAFVKDGDAWRDTRQAAVGITAGSRAASP